MKKCLLLGYFGHRNLGDDLLYEEAMLKLPEEYEIMTLGCGEHLKEIAVRKITRLPSLKSLIFTPPHLTIFNGGGVFPAKQYPLGTLLKHLIIWMVSKKMIINGVGIVPKKGYWNNFRFNLFLHMLHYISVRDDVSKQYAESLIGKRRCVNCHDLYFGKTLSSVSKKREGVLVCLANPFSKNEKENFYVNSRYLKLVAQVQELLLVMKLKYGQLTFMPFFLGSDEIFIQDVCQHPSLNQSKVITPYVDFQLKDVDTIFCQYEIGVCMRFHSFVLSVRNVLPFVGICYDHKSESLLAEMGLADVGVRYGIRNSQFFGIEQDIDKDRLCECFQYVVQNERSIVETLNQFRQKYHQQVNDNYKSIYSIIGQ